MNLRSFFNSGTQCVNPTAIIIFDLYQPCWFYDNLLLHPFIYSYCGQSFAHGSQPALDVSCMGFWTHTTHCTRGCCRICWVDVCNRIHNLFLGYSDFVNSGDSSEYCSIDSLHTGLWNKKEKSFGQSNTKDVCPFGKCISV